MDRFLFFLFCLALWGLCSGSLLAHDALPPLILQLGDDDFQRRVEAERELIKQGTSGLDSLGAGVRSGDPEIRQRSLRLQELLQRTAFTEQRERVKEDPWTVAEDLAPGWEVFQSFVGDGPAARDLYVRMIEQEEELMQAVALRPETWPEEFERRCADFRTFVNRRRHRDLDPVSVLALLFLAEHPANRLNPRTSQTIASLLVDSTFYNYVQHASHEEATVFRAMLSRWVTNSIMSSAPSRLQLATKFQLEAGRYAAEELIRNRNGAGQSRTQLQNAIRFLSDSGDLSAVRELEPLLDLSSVEFPTIEVNPLPWDSIPHPPAAPSRVDLLVSDLALQALVKLTHQDPTSYGFSESVLGAGHRRRSNVPMFKTEEERRRALSLWQSWRLKHREEFVKFVHDASLGWAL